MPWNKPAYVYTYFGRANKPIGVWDAAITGERWVVPPAELHLHSVIPTLTVNAINAATYLLLQSGKRIKPILRHAQVAHASRILGQPMPFPGNPEDYILSCIPNK